MHLKIRNLLLSTCILACAGCATKPPASGLPGKWPNDCLPQAIAMTEGLREKRVKADVLLIWTPEWNHAVVRYLYPPGDNQLWIWDANWNSLRFRVFTDDAPAAARAWMSKVHPGKSITKAEWLN